MRTKPSSRRRSSTSNPGKTARGVTFDVVCEDASKLPGVERGLSYGTPALRVKGKFLLRLKEDGESVAIRIPMEDRDVLLEVDPKVFYITDHYVGYPAILFRLSEIRRDQLHDLLELAWRFVAPKRLVAEREARSREDARR